MLTTSDFDYPLETELIAQAPLERRDESRLMTLERSCGAIGHRVFRELPDLLTPGDLLVMNDTRVIPAKFATRRRTGGRIEGLFLREISDEQWEVMLKGAGKCKDGEVLALEGADGVVLELQENLGAGRWLVGVTPATPAVELLERAGTTPLPPYIRRETQAADAADRTRYQTLYADKPGAVAAPTAGLHFTEDVLTALDDRGIETAKVTLHVSLGTFLPVKDEDLLAHDMHSEWYDMPAQTARRLTEARSAGRRIVAIGTTSVRVLESAGAACDPDQMKPCQGWTDLFLYPPAEFGWTDAMITNFHLPRSTLLMLVAAFCAPGETTGREMILNAYAAARRQKYRFYSYGDAMLIT